MFAPEKGIENPIIRRAMQLCEESGMKVTYHEDTVEVWFAPNNKRFYTIWSQFLADAEAIFGDRMHVDRPSTGQERRDFGARAAAASETNASETNASAPPPPPAYRNGADHSSNGAMTQELSRLRSEIKVLERAIRVVGMQREEWKREAEGLKAELELTRTEIAQLHDARASWGAGSSGPDRYKQVRQIIVRRLHPDIAGTDEEKAYREKLFKSIWQDIEVLDRK